MCERDQDLKNVLELKHSSGNRGVELDKSLGVCNPSFEDDGETIDGIPTPGFGFVHEDIHIHCAFCVKFTKCTPLKAGISCEIVSCDLDCGAVFHECKLEEHRNLCVNEKVPCVNMCYGCPCIMLRKNCAKHLNICPASIIHCTMQWKRWPLSEICERKLEECVKGVQERNEQLPLDVAFVLRDQRFLRRHATKSSIDEIQLQLQYQSIYGKEKIKVLLERNQYVELENQRLAKALQYLHQTTALCEKALMDLNSSRNHSNGDVSHSFCRYALRKSCREMYDLKCAVNKDNKGDSTGEVNFVRAVTSFPARFLSIVTKPQYTFPDYMDAVFCSEVFRRDEYPWHYKNVHNDIHCGLNSWLQERCPLAQYGCSFFRQRFNPSPNGSKIVYNEVIEAFGVLPSSPGCSSNGDKTSALAKESCLAVSSHESMTLIELPYKVLRHIARFLDSFSLSNLSLTSCLMRDVCKSLLVERGIVTYEWIRKEKGEGFAWEEGSKKWRFSSHFTPVKKWNFDISINMSNHLKECCFFQRNILKQHLSALMAKNCTIIKSRPCTKK